MLLVGKVDDKTLGEWIDLYLEKHGPCLKKYLAHYTNLSPKDAIRQAVEGRGGDIHRHQYHVGKRKLRRVAGILTNCAKEIGLKESFDDLYDVIREKTKAVKGFGKLATYDTALRLSFRLHCLPKDVYLHAGAKKGYAAFKHCGLLKTQAVGGRVKWDDLPAIWKRLGRAYHVENFLCIFKDGKPKDCNPKDGCFD